MKVGELAGEYLFYRFMGLPFFLLTVSYRGFFFGIGKTKIFMFSGILVNFLNIIFNYFFIFGMFGYEGMGLAGAGLGSSLATVCDALFYFTVTSLEKYRETYKYFYNFKFFKDIAKSIVKISLPVSFQNVFILIGFLSFVALTGIIGTREQAASQVVISSLMISLMPCFGFGIAVQTLVGNQLGSGKFQLARYYGFETSKVATLYTLIVGIIFIFCTQAYSCSNYQRSCGYRNCCSCFKGSGFWTNILCYRCNPGKRTSGNGADFLCNGCRGGC